MVDYIDVKSLAERLQISEIDMQLVIEKKLDITSIKKSTNPTTTPLIATLEQQKAFFQKEDITLYNEDFLTSSQLSDSSIDLIVTSPPYNVGIEYGIHNDKDDYTEYLKFSHQWLTKCYQVARSDGRLCMNIPLDKNKGGQQSICADLTAIAKEIGWQYHSTIIWNEGNISRRTAWGSWMSASAPYVIAPVEVIVVMFKEKWKKVNKKGKTSGISRDEFMAWTNGVWTFNGESKKRIGHPAPFPRELPKRCIKLFSFEGDVVLDPFVGSGTTLLEAISNDRVGIGYDLDLHYCDLAKDRIEKECLKKQAKLI